MKEDGTYTEIYSKWFKEDPPDSILNTEPGESADAGSGSEPVLSDRSSICRRGAPAAPLRLGVEATAPSHRRHTGWTFSSSSTSTSTSCATTSATCWTGSG